VGGGPVGATTGGHVHGGLNDGLTASASNEGREQQHGAHTVSLPTHHANVTPRRRADTRQDQRKTKGSMPPHRVAWWAQQRPDAGY
jgi:hypothetical protein